MNTRLLLSALALATAAALTLGSAQAQVAGTTTTLGVSVTESSQLAMGWSAKKSLLGKTVYNEAGAKVGKVEDLIIAPDKNLSYVIVGAGGFIGIGRHDVAVPVSQIQASKGRLVMAGATKDSVKAMAPFTYTNDSAKRDAFVAAADKDIARAKVRVADLDKKASTASADVKTRLDQQGAALKTDLTAAEDKLGSLRQAAASRWHEFEADVSAATAKLRKSMDSATG